jgi:hypothetical protein
MCGISLKGIIFLHRINDNRMGASGLRYLNIFRKIWGDEALPNVALVSTMWSEVDTSLGLRRHLELRRHFWGDMVDKGAYMFQYDGSSEQAQTIVGQLLTKKDVVLKIQRELLGQHKPLWDTSAGKMVHSDLESRIEDSRKNIKRLGEEIRAAEAADDISTARKLEKKRDEQRRKLHRQLEDRSKVRDVDVESETGDRIWKAEKEGKKKWSKAFDRIQKFLQILSPVVSITLNVLTFVGFAAN